ncbi:electron transport complex subunit RsxB [Acidovorax sp.]|uniref:electron transport complex subunit RsxB n=1 Tax=Acidovorax sp. TaxID=1872122 RepID=UPI0025C29EB6|nr:electron transport complex subunit RsxB [Acidovorax sp.]MBL7088935.1 electron transport complex subunit RsxB [Acidovorax sp.]
MSHPVSASSTPSHAAPADLAARIDAALPQTQCTRCGYPDCASYAQAIAQGEAAINQCPPGGAEGIARLAAITGHAVTPLSADHGVEAPRSVAFIDEAWCIGCTLCIKACPTDAIVGSNKKMHTVLEPYCTGCELCIPVCPVDCIQLDSASGTATGWAAWSDSLAHQAKQRYLQHRQRVPLEDIEDEGSGAKADSTSAARSNPAAAAVAAEGMEARKAAIAAAMERARQLREKGAR